VPNSQRETVLAAFAALVNGASKPSGLTVVRFGVEPIEQADLPLVLIYPIEESAERIGSRQGHLTQQRLVVRCEVTANLGSAGQAADAALDGIYQWIVSQVCANNGDLGVAANGCNYLGASWDADMKERTYARANYDFAVMYQNAVADTTKKSS
jgi:hypothetical protein